MRFSWRLNVGRALMLTSLLLAASCATHQPEPPPAIAPAPVVVAPPPPRQTTTTRPRTVTASFQGYQSAGRPTASGERYDPDDLTAASKTLPIGSKVEVTNPRTGKSVLVRINDRGPHVRGRSLDLSKRAADELGITDKGVARLKIRRVTSSRATKSDTEAPHSQPNPASASTP